MNSLINNCFDIKSSATDLNYSGTRKIKVVVEAVYPTVKSVIRLVAVDHNCHIDMSKETFSAVMSRASRAISAMNNETETKIFENEYIDVFTERMHDKCAVCFVDQNDVQINMMVKTFKSMKSNCYQILSECETIYSTINSTAAKYKTIVDVIFNKMEQRQLNDEEFKNFVSEIKQHIDTLHTLKTPRIQNYVDSEDDETAYLSYEIEDDYKKCYKCGCSCKYYR